MTTAQTIIELTPMAVSAMLLLATFIGILSEGAMACITQNSHGRRGVDGAGRAVLVFFMTRSWCSR